MAIDWENVTPEWARGLGDMLPDEVTKVYASEDETEGTARILALSPAGLFGCYVKGGRGSQGWGSRLEVNWLPLTSILGVQVTFHAGRDWPAKEHDVRISLDRELPEFVNPLTLPLDKSDYGGQPKKAREAAAEFARDLFQFLGH